MTSGSSGCAAPLFQMFWIQDMFTAIENVVTPDFDLDKEFLFYIHLFFQKQQTIVGFDSLMASYTLRRDNW